MKVPLNAAGQPHEHLTDMDVEEQLGQFGCLEDHGYDVRTRPAICAPRL